MMLEVNSSESSSALLLKSNRFEEYALIIKCFFVPLINCLDIYLKAQKNTLIKTETIEKSGIF